MVYVFMIILSLWMAAILRALVITLEHADIPPMSTFRAMLAGLRATFLGMLILAGGGALWRGQGEPFSLLWYLFCILLTAVITIRIMAEFSRNIFINGIIISTVVSTLAWLGANGVSPVIKCFSITNLIIFIFSSVGMSMLISAISWSQEKEAPNGR